MVFKLVLRDRIVVFPKTVLFSGDEIGFLISDPFYLVFYFA